MAVIGDGLTVSQAAEKTGVARQTLHRWLARYEAQGLDGLADRSHRRAGLITAETTSALRGLRARQDQIRSRWNSRPKSGRDGDFVSLSVDRRRAIDPG